MTKLQEPANRSKIRCPKCDSAAIDRIPRTTAFKYLLFWTGLRRFQCNKCDNKFYA